jgi:LAO/AO transport system kinase
MEMADAIVINKADGDIKRTNLAQIKFNRAFSCQKIRLDTTAACSAITHEGIPEVWQTIQKF